MAMIFEKANVAAEVIEKFRIARMEEAAEAEGVRCLKTINPGAAGEQVVQRARRKPLDETHRLTLHLGA